jgi:hypothetical protein
MSETENSELKIPKCPECSAPTSGGGLCFICEAEEDGDS